MQLLDYTETLESAPGKKAGKELLPLQLGDVPDTYADVEALLEEVGYRPKTNIKKGICNFVTWYKGYFKV